MRGPPVSKEASESPAAICSSESILRAAASSIASGKPSSSRHKRGHGPGVLLVRAEAGRYVAGTLDEERHHPVRAGSSARLVRSERTELASRSRRPPRAALGWSPATTTSGQACRSASTTWPGLEQVLAIVKHDQRPPRGEIGGDGLKLGEARQRPHLSRPRQPSPRPAVPPRAAPGRPTRRRPGSGPQPRSEPQAQPGLAAASRPVSVSSRVADNASRSSPSSRCDQRSSTGPLQVVREGVERAHRQDSRTLRPGPAALPQSHPLFCVRAQPRDRTGRNQPPTTTSALSTRERQSASICRVHARRPCVT
jgi:hypothetical protein